MTDPSSDSAAVPTPPLPAEPAAPPPVAAPAPVPVPVHMGGLPISSSGTRFLSYLLEMVLIVVTLVIGWLIWWVILWSRAQSPAKQVMKLRVVKIDENRPATFGEMALREFVGKGLLGSVTSGITTVIGGIMVLADGRGRQALWDKMAATTVVDDPTNHYGL